MKYKIILFAVSLISFAGSLSAQGFVAAGDYLANITYGYDTSVYDSAFGVANDTWGRIYDSTGTTPLAQDDSVSAIGYFTTLPSSWSANIDIFDDFVVLAQGGVETLNGTPFPGDFNNTEGNVNVNTAIGKTPFLAVFKGITDTDNYASATEFALLSSGTWDTLNGSFQLPPAPPLQLAYTIGKTAIGAGVYVGTEVDDTRFEPDEGFNYNTAVVIPEPSTISLLIGLSALLFVARRR